MGFRTKLDFSDNRQVKQRIETTTILSGGTAFGVPYGYLPTGPNTNLSSITQTINNLTGTFSGNSGTTIFTWVDTRMSLGDSSLSAITPSNSATTQNTGAIFTPDISSLFNIDGNTGYTHYTGVSYSVYASSFANLGGGAYSGDLTSQILEILETTGLDFTGRTIWNDVSGITRTDRLIIGNNPQVGYVWTCIDSEGMGEWSFNASGATIWTAGTGTGSAVLGGSDGYAGDWCVAAGLGVSATTNYSFAEGFFTLADGSRSHAEGSQTQALGGSSHAEGAYTIASGSTAHAEGDSTIAGGARSHAEGLSTQALGLDSHAEGQATIASGNQSHAEGRTTIASGDYGSHAEGEDTIASGSTSHAEGYNTIAGGDYSHAEGTTTKALGSASHAEGNFTIASGDYGSHAEGMSSIASGQTSHAEGNSTIAGGGNSHAQGQGSIASGNNSHAEGLDTQASGNNSHAEGWLAKASGATSHAQGYNTTASGDYSHAQGYSTIASGITSHAEGVNTIAGGQDSHAQGTSTQALGYSSHAEGANTIASGQTAHAEGGFSNAGGDYSHAEGYLSQANGNYSHAEGINTRATGSTSHAEGAGSIAGGTYSHAEGQGSIASGFVSHAEGNFSTANGSFSHAQGSATVASGSSAHAEGTNSIAGGDDSHAQGRDTQSIGDYSHAGGYFSKALNDYSFVHGQSSVASNTNTIVFGKNITGTTAETLYTNNLIIDNQNGLFTSKLGINTSTPVYVIDARGGTNNKFYYDGTFGGGAGAVILSARTGLALISVNTDTSVVNKSGSLSIGMRAWDDATYSGYGKQGDSHIYSSTKSNGLNIISSDGTGTEDYIRFWTGGDCDTPSSMAMNIVGSGTSKGYVGINTLLPTERLHVNGSLKVVDGTQQDGYVFTSDANGKGSWQENPLGAFMAGKSPEAIPIHSLTAKGIPDGTVITNYTSIYYNDTDISGTLTTPFGTFNNATGLFTTNTDCVLNVEAWVHLKADTSSTVAWESGATPTQIGIGVCPNNTTDIAVGDFLTILPSVSRGLDLGTGVTFRVLSGSSFRVKVLNQTSRAYPGSGVVSGDYIRFSITRIA